VTLVEAVQAGLNSPEEMNGRLSMLPRSSFDGGEKHRRESAAEENDEDREPPPREPQPPHLPSPTQQDQLVAQLKDEIQVLLYFKNSKVNKSNNGFYV
jgi:hypothetical protein